VVLNEEITIAAPMPTIAIATLCAQWMQSGNSSQSIIGTLSTSMETKRDNTIITMVERDHDE